MSREARDWAYSQPIKAPLKPVLVALAEHANEYGGNCWPSLSRLVEMTGFSKASVARVLAKLDGWLIERQRSKGGKSTGYKLNMLVELSHSEPVELSTTVSERDLTVAQRDSRLSHTETELSQSETQTVSNRQLNRQEPTKRKRKPPERTKLPPWLPHDLWDEFLEHRKKLKSPMTDLAQNRAINAVSQLRDEGHDPEEVIGQSVMNGWKGLFPVKNQQAGKQDKFAASVAALNSIFGENNGQGDFSAGHGIHGSSVFGGDPAGESRRVLGSAGRITG